MKDVAARLLSDIGVHAPCTWQRLAGGANNRVFRVEAGGAPYLLKAYFHDESDPRDRLGVEFGFLTFAWEHGVRAVPRPLAVDGEAHAALYEFIAGERLAAGGVGEEEVRQAAALAVALNAHRTEAATLPPASEACFSLAGHLDRIEQRVARLAAVDDDALGAAAGFVRGELLPAWREVADAVRSGAARQGFHLEAVLSLSERCLSPSDFGFHNALRCAERPADGTLRFVDFEYAGWDDPAKLLGDFRFQPAVPVPPEHHDAFAAAVLSLFDQPEWHRRRAELLLPAYRVKWCCILLNEFLPEGAARRRFAGESSETRRQEQLAKARTLLAGSE